MRKVNSASSPKGKVGQKYLACGVGLGMRLWENIAAGKDVIDLLMRVTTVSVRTVAVTEAMKKNAVAIAIQLHYPFALGQPGRLADSGSLISHA